LIGGPPVVCRLAALKAEQRRHAMELAESYRVEQERRKIEQEERVKDTAVALRRLREQTRARLVQQKVRRW